MKGLIRLAKVKKAPCADNGYNCIIQACDSNSIYQAICNPSPYGWALPEVDALVEFIDGPYVKRIVAVLHDIDTSGRSLDQVYHEQESAFNIARNHGGNPGDVYVGKYGRSYYTKAGDVDVVSFSTHARLFLEQKTGNSYLYGDNLDLGTNGQTVRILTRAASGATGAIGDTLAITSAAKGVSGATGPIQTAIGLDNVGNVAFQVGFTGGTPVTGLNLGVNGVFQAFCGAGTFGDAFVGLELDQNSKVATLNSQGDIDLIATDTLNIQADTVQVDANKIMLGSAEAQAIVIAQKLLPLLLGHYHLSASPGLPTGPLVSIKPITLASIASTIVNAV